jgi:hypothetical protein
VLFGTACVGGARRALVAVNEEPSVRRKYLRDAPGRCEGDGPSRLLLTTASSIQTRVRSPAPKARRNSTPSPHAGSPGCNSMSDGQIRPSAMNNMVINALRSTRRHLSALDSTEAVLPNPQTTKKTVVDSLLHCAVDIGSAHPRWDNPYSDLMSLYPPGSSRASLRTTSKSVKPPPTQATQPALRSR